MASIEPTPAIPSRKIDRRISDQHLVDVRSLRDLRQQHQTIPLIDRAVVIPPKSISHCQSWVDPPAVAGVNRILVLSVVSILWRTLISGGLTRSIEGL